MEEQYSTHTMLHTLRVRFLGQHEESGILLRLNAENTRKALIITRRIHATSVWKMSIIAWNLLGWVLRSGNTDGYIVLYDKNGDLLEKKTVDEVIHPPRKMPPPQPQTAEFYRKDTETLVRV